MAKIKTFANLALVLNEDNIILREARKRETSMGMIKTPGKTRIETEKLPVKMILKIISSIAGTNVKESK
jgi:hypothetical protein